MRDRLKGWQALCFNPVTAPLNAETIAAILKLYPGFVAASTARRRLCLPIVRWVSPQRCNPDLRRR
jgi:hypothetical protein